METRSVVVIGAGIGGMTFAVKARKKWGDKLDFVIYEKADGVGGTWRANIYPGCACDVPVHYYSLSNQLNPDFGSTHPAQPEILAYWESVARKQGILPHIQFNTEVTNVEWIASESRYRISINKSNGEAATVFARIVVSALGFLEVPNLTSIPGVDTFKGDSFHCARWDYTVQLKNRRIGVIGNGASATQFVPKIAQEHSSQITHFCRTPNYLLPPRRSEYSPLWLWLFRRFPIFMRFVRYLTFCKSEFLYFLVFHSQFMRRIASAWALWYIRAYAPKRDVPKLTPQYTMGCKRVIFDSGYLDCLHQSNINICWDHIKEIVPEGILTKAGETHPLDVLIYGTGYAADRYPLRVVGSSGLTIQEYYDTQKGPTAYLGLSIPNFPNFFMLSGPNANTGHASSIYLEECQMTHILQCLDKLLFKMPTLVALSVSQEATDRYNVWLQTRLRKGVFYSCDSWYRVNGVGKVTSIFPGSGTLFWWMTRQVKWEDYSLLLKSSIPGPGTLSDLL
ncbi:hypothetical protein DL96DRAFT_705710 [Flagelloscypha sp. PMI_526]|nr:hypothetical protein DL96DRAFT_705710 [Flagelloscypha sp. PMI_526]